METILKTNDTYLITLKDHAASQSVNYQKVAAQIILKGSQVCLTSSQPVTSPEGVRDGSQIADPERSLSKTSFRLALNKDVIRCKKCRTSPSKKNMVQPFPLWSLFPPVDDSLVTNSCPNSALPHSKWLFIIWEQLQFVATFPVGMGGGWTAYVRNSH